MIQNRRDFLKSLGVFAIPTFLRYPIPAFEQEVIVIGAGLGGLYVAKALEANGLTVKILEGSLSVGGKLKSLVKKAGLSQPARNLIALEDVRLKKLLKLMEVGTDNKVIKNDQAYSIYYQGKIINPDDWNINTNSVLNYAEQEVPPNYWAETWLNRYSIAEIDNDFTQNWYKEGFESLDNNLLDYFKTKNLVSQEGTRLLAQNSVWNTAEEVSVLWAKARQASWQFAKPNNATYPTDSWENIAQKLARTIRGGISFNKQVTHINAQKQAFQLKCSDGTSYYARFVVCTLPFSVLRQMKLSADLSKAHKDAIAKMPYSSLVQAYFFTKNNFWEEDKLPLKIWTDTLAGQLLPLYDKDGLVRGIEAHIRGASATALDALPEKQAIEQIIKTIATIRPSTSNHLDLYALQSWQKDKWARGAVPYFPPKVSSKWLPALANPAGKLYFVGEHTALTTGGQEGVLESAERSVQAILQRVKK